MVSINFKSMHITCIGTKNNPKPDFNIEGSYYVDEKQIDYGYVKIISPNGGFLLPDTYSSTLAELCEPIGDGKNPDKLPSENEVREKMPKILDECVQNMIEKMGMDYFRGHFDLEKFKRQLLEGFGKTQYKRTYAKPYASKIHRVDFIYPREEKL